MCFLAVKSSGICTSLSENSSRTIRQAVLRNVQDDQGQHSIALIPQYILFEKIFTPQDIPFRTIFRGYLAIMIE